MFEWTDPDTGDVYEIIYNVTQTEDEGPEHFMWRLKKDEKTHWEKLPPFVSSAFMAEMELECFGGLGINPNDKVIAHFIERYGPVSPRCQNCFKPTAWPVMKCADCVMTDGPPDFSCGGIQ